MKITFISFERMENRNAHYLKNGITVHQFSKRFLKKMTGVITIDFFYFLDFEGGTYIL